MKAVIKVLFDDMDKIAQTFQKNADDIANVHKDIRAAQDTSRVAIGSARVRRNFRARWKIPSILRCKGFSG